MHAVRQLQLKGVHSHAQSQARYYSAVLLYTHSVTNPTAECMSQIFADRTASLRLLEKYSPETLGKFHAPLRFTEYSSSESRGDQSPENKVHKGWGTKLTEAAATKQRGGAAAQKAHGSRRGTSWHVDLALAQAGVSRQEYEAMMFAEGVSPEDLMAAESQFEDLVEHEGDVQSGNSVAFSRSQRLALVRLANKMKELSRKHDLSATADLAGKPSIGSRGASIKAAASNKFAQCLAESEVGKKGDPLDKGKLPEPDVACSGGSCEQPAAASARIGRALFEWFCAEPQRSHPKKWQIAQASDFHQPIPHNATGPHC